MDRGPPPRSVSFGDDRSYSSASAASTAGGEANHDATHQWLQKFGTDSTNAAGSAGHHRRLWPEGNGPQDFSTPTHPFASSGEARPLPSADAAATGNPTATSPHSRTSNIRLPSAAPEPFAPPTTFFTTTPNDISRMSPVPSAAVPLSQLTVPATPRPSTFMTQTHLVPPAALSQGVIGGAPTLAGVSASKVPGYPYDRTKRGDDADDDDDDGRGEQMRREAQQDAQRLQEQAFQAAASWQHMQRDVGSMFQQVASCVSSLTSKASQRELDLISMAAQFQRQSALLETVWSMSAESKVDLAAVKDVTSRTQQSTIEVSEFLQQFVRQEQLQYQSLVGLQGHLQAQVRQGILQQLQRGTLQRFGRRYFQKWFHWYRRWKAFIFIQKQYRLSLLRKIWSLWLPWAKRWRRLRKLYQAVVYLEEKNLAGHVYYRWSMWQRFNTVQKIRKRAIHALLYRGSAGTMRFAYQQWQKFVTSQEYVKRERRKLQHSCGALFDMTGGRLRRTYLNKWMKWLQKLKLKRQRKRVSAFMMKHVVLRLTSIVWRRWLRWSKQRVHLRTSLWCMTRRNVCKLYIEPAYRLWKKKIEQKKLLELFQEHYMIPMERKIDIGLRTSVNSNDTLRMLIEKIQDLESKVRDMDKRKVAVYQLKPAAFRFDVTEGMTVIGGDGALQGSSAAPGGGGGGAHYGSSSTQGMRPLGGGGGYVGAGSAMMQAVHFNNNGPPSRSASGPPAMYAVPAGGINDFDDRRSGLGEGKEDDDPVGLELRHLMEQQRQLLAQGPFPPAPQGHPAASKFATQDGTGRSLSVDGHAALQSLHPNAAGASFISPETPNSAAAQPSGRMWPSLQASNFKPPPGMESHWQFHPDGGEGIEKYPAAMAPPSQPPFSNRVLQLSRAVAGPISELPQQLSRPSAAPSPPFEAKPLTVQEIARQLSAGAASRPGSRPDSPAVSSSGTGGHRKVFGRSGPTVTEGADPSPYRPMQSAVADGNP